VKGASRHPSQASTVPLGAASVGVAVSITCKNTRDWARRPVCVGEVASNLGRRCFERLLEVLRAGGLMRRESRVTAIRRRQRANIALRVHVKYLKRKHREMGTSVCEGLRALLWWLSRRARRQRWLRLRLRRRYATTVIEMYRRNARLQRLYRRRVCNRPPVRVRWVIEADRRSCRIDEVWPPPMPAKVAFSRQGSLRAWLASTKRTESHDDA